MWERLQYEERFQFVPATLVVHVIVNHLEDDMEKDGKSYWWFEDSETRAGVARARAWAAVHQRPEYVHQRPEYGSPGTSRLSPDDLFISANTDEVMSREALHKLRWCKLNGKSPISGALWMPMGNLNLAFRSDFPVRGRPHTYGFPTIYRQVQEVIKMICKYQVGGDLRFKICKCQVGGDCWRKGRKASLVRLPRSKVGRFVS